MSLFRTFLLVLAILPYRATAAFSVENYTKKLPTGTHVALVVQPIEGTHPIVMHNADIKAPPASTQKIITALAALLELGPTFQFSTTFESNAAIENGILKGDLIARFTGDPSLTKQQIFTLANQLKARGIKKIKGNLIVDTAIFASHDRAPGWSWDNITQCYNAPPAAAIIDRNCFSIQLNTAVPVGHFAITTVLDNTAVTVTSQVRSYPKDAAAAKFCEFDIIAKDNNHYLLTGCVTQQSSPVTLSFAIQDAGLSAGKLIKLALSSAGISVTGKILENKQPMSPMKILASVNSAPLTKLLTFMLKRSDNITADSLFRVIGHHYYQQPGTWKNASYAVKKILKTRANIDVRNSIILDGSGLSRQNLISANILMQILHYIISNNTQLGIIEMLPIAGRDGTLTSRKSFIDAQLVGKVSAKTGALNNVYNLAGVMQSAKGHSVAFVQFITGYVPDKNSAGKASLYNFESSLYRDIYLEY